MNATIYRPLAGLLFLSVLVTTPTAADAPEDPRSILEKAVQAHGGEAKIAKTLTGSIKAKATIAFGPKFEAAVQWEEIFKLPYAYWRVVEGAQPGKQFRLEYAVTEEGSWLRQDGGKPMPIPARQQPVEKTWHASPALLTRLLNDKYELKVIGPAKVNGRDATGVRVAGPDLQADLYFDAVSGLLVKSARKMPHPLTEMEVDGELFFSDYRQMSGVQYPMRLTSYAGGKKIMEMEVTEVRFLKNVNESVFAKPK